MSMGETNMANVEKDPVTGTETTGHEWDGIKELNSPLPKWWVYLFWATVVWAVGYMVVYPSFPGSESYVKGIKGYSSRAELDKELERAAEDRSGWLTQFQEKSAEEIATDPTLLQYAMAGGEIAFLDNCAPCHQAGGAGAIGYPALTDDEWLWGGTLEEIETTIRYGVRMSDDGRFNEMPAYGFIGEDGMTETQLSDLADFVLAMSEGTDVDFDSDIGIMYLDGCAACHGERGEGVNIMGGPALNNRIWLFGGEKEDIIAQIVDPQHGEMPPWEGRLDEATIKQLTVYVHSLGGGQSDIAPADVAGTEVAQ